MKNLNLWRKAEIPQNEQETQIRFNRIKQANIDIKPRVIKKKVPVFKETNKLKSKSKNPIIAENKLMEANQLQLIDSQETDKENLSQNVARKLDRDTTFQQLDEPVLAIKRKPMDKIEKEIGIKRWSKNETPINMLKTINNQKEESY